VSISERHDPVNDFECWAAGAYAKAGTFTVLVVLIEIVGRQATPMCSTWFNVVDGAVEWSEIAVMFAGAGGAWDGAAF
jgi:hypothetical protein